MKTMTCRQLGGACDQKFSAATFDEIAGMSKKHGMEMLQKGDKAHVQAMSEMQKTMMSPEAMSRWMENKRREFEELPGDK
ncbi:MAG TPA: DUF1059 domain-containing protein [Cyclobacteriaceae bacterium]|nr:DUF1059 domain-containing protein [Cyclobacteriaceae bacterium]